MTYAKGSPILASDFNNFAGLTGTAAPDASLAQNRAGYLWGVGFGDRGYGQTTPPLTAKSAGQPIGQEWQNLRTVVANLAAWQGTSTLLLPPSSSFNAGTTIIAHERDNPSSNAYDFQDLLALVDANRLNYQLANMSLMPSVVSTSRSTPWGLGNSGITCTFQVQFADEDAARYFFNTGGELRLTLGHPTGAAPRDQSWYWTFFNLAIAFGAHQTKRLSGSHGTANDIGYYELSTVFQTIFDGTNSGAYAYSANDFIVEARATAIPGANGAKGSILQFKVTITDQFVSTVGDAAVSSGTTATLGHFRATNTISVAAPLCTVPTTFG